MNPSTLTDLYSFVEKNALILRENISETLTSLDLPNLLKRNNLYYVRTKNLSSAHDFIKSLLDEAIFSQVEELFNESFKRLAIHIASQVYQGKESIYDGIDLEFTRDGVKYFVTFGIDPKSPDDYEIQVIEKTFSKIKIDRAIEIPDIPVRAVYGCFYGVDNQPDKGDYFILCGQKFWEFVSGDPDCYLKIIEPVSKLSFLRNDSCFDEYSRLLNKLEAEFLCDFCPDGLIDWPKLIKLNSGSSRI